MNRLLLVFALLHGLAGAAVAQTWPQRPLRLIVPFAAGGSADMFARLIVPKMAASLGQPLVIENRGGAGGVVGNDVVAKAAADGYTIGLSGTGALVAAPHLIKIPYSPAEDLAYITMVARVSNILAVNSKLGFNSVADLIGAARRDPGKLNFGSAGNGTTLHLAGELLKQEAKIDIVHVPYKGVAPAITDLISGRVQILVGNANAMIAQVRSGAIKALAVTSLKRTDLLPDVPSMAEVGMPSVVVEDVYGLIAPAKTPQEVLQKLATAGTAAAGSPDVAEKFAQAGAAASPSTPEEYRRWMLSNSAKWGDVIKRGSITAN